MPLTKCKIHLELNWSNNCVMSATDETTFKITNTKLCVPIVTLSSKDNAKLVKSLEDGLADLFIGTNTKKNRNKKFRQQ